LCAVSSALAIGAFVTTWAVVAAIHAFFLAGNSTPFDYSSAVRPEDAGGTRP
jgi:hypothetical protein